MTGGLHLSLGKKERGGKRFGFGLVGPWAVSRSGPEWFRWPFFCFLLFFFCFLKCFITFVFDL
jgi:hypothetical protein